MSWYECPPHSKLQPAKPLPERKGPVTRKQPLSSVEKEKEDSDEGGCMNWLWPSKHTEAAPPAPDTNIGSEALRPEAPKFVPQAWEQEEVLTEPAGEGSGPSPQQSEPEPENDLPAPGPPEPSEPLEEDPFAPGDPEDLKEG